MELFYVLYGIFAGAMGHYYTKQYMKKIHNMDEYEALARDDSFVRGVRMIAFIFSVILAPVVLFGIIVESLKYRKDNIHG